MITQSKSRLELSIVAFMIFLAVLMVAGVEL